MHVDPLTQHERTYCEANFKRLERGTFQILTVAGAEGVELSYAQLVRLLGGLDLTTGRRRKRYRRPA
jgi:hypothetical protein